MNVRIMRLLRWGVANETLTALLNGGLKAVAPLRRIVTRKRQSIAILSLGAAGHSYSAARAARALGLHVVLVGRTLRAHEMIFADEFVEHDPLEETQAVIDALRGRGVQAVTISIKHVLLPAQVAVSEALGLRSCGARVAHLSNDKLAWRRALEEAGIEQPRFAETREAFDAVPCVQKVRMGTGSKGIALLQADEDARDDVTPLHDRSVGQERYFEEFLVGPQFDVEGVSRDGVHRTLVIVQEYYVEHEGQFPPRAFVFNPPLPEGMSEAAEAAARATLDASGVVNGAWHVEMRYHDGAFKPVDFANRMGYERLVTLASGVDFARTHVRAFLPEATAEPEGRPLAVAQLFAFDEPDADAMRRIAEAHPDAVFDAVLEPFDMGTVRYRAMICLKACDHDALRRVAGRLLDLD